MQTTNLPSSSSVSTNLPTSLLVSSDRLMQAVSSYGQQFLVDVFQRYQNPPVSMHAAAMSHAPSMRRTANSYSRAAMLMWLRFHIAETFAFLGIYDTASKGQIQQTAELILDHEIYGALNLHEFLMFTKRFKCGDYGKIYQSARPNPQEFLVCLKDFWSELVKHRIEAMNQEDMKRQQEIMERSKETAMTYEEWQEIKMLTRMYEMNIRHDKTLL